MDSPPTLLSKSMPKIYPPISKKFSEFGKQVQLKDSLTILLGSMREFGERMKRIVGRGKKVAEIAHGIEDFDLSEIQILLNSLEERSAFTGGVPKEQVEKILRHLVNSMLDFRDRLDHLDSAIIVLEREILKRELEDAKK